MAIFNSYVSLPEGIYWCMIGVWLFSKITRDARNGWAGVFEMRDFPWLRPLWFFTNYTKWVNVYIANWRITIFKFGKSTISIRAMFQFANCHSHYQRLYQLSNWSWWIIPSYKKNIAMSDRNCTHDGHILNWYSYTSIAGWWFGTWLLFSPRVGMMIQSD